MRAVLLVALGGLMHAARSFAPQAELREPGQVTLALGFLLLAAYLTGSLFKRLGLPRLTGYLSAGLIAGPYALAFVGEGTLESLRIFNGIAIALIALTAGSELHFATLRPVLRTIAWTSLVSVVGTAILIAAGIFVCAPYLAFLPSEDLLQRAAVSTVLGVTIVAQSPAVVVALRDEMDAEGPVSTTVLGVVVLADMLVIVLFAIASALTKAALGGGADAFGVASDLAYEFLGSSAAGIVLGVLLALYMRKVSAGGTLFLLAVSFVVAEVGQRIHLDPLIVALVMGMTIRNGTTMGERLHKEIEAGSLPVYVVFFAVAGAGIHLDALRTIGLWAAGFVVLRAAGLYLGTRAAARIARAPEAVARYAGFGLWPQAGLALALALLLERTFPEFGPQAAALVFSIVAINEMVSPVVYRIALVRSGEAGKARREALPEPDPDLPDPEGEASAAAT